MTRSCWMTPPAPSAFCAGEAGAAEQAVAPRTRTRPETTIARVRRPSMGTSFFSLAFLTNGQYPDHWLYGESTKKFQLSQRTRDTQRRAILDAAREAFIQDGY